MPGNGARSVPHPPPLACPLNNTDLMYDRPHCNPRLWHKSVKIVVEVFHGGYLTCHERNHSNTQQFCPAAWRNRAPGPHRNTARQAMDGLWTEVCGKQKQSNDPGNNQHILNTPSIGRR